MKLSDADNIIRGFRLQLEGSVPITDLELYRMANSRELKLFLLRKYDTVSKAVDDKYRQIRERTEVQEEVGWVRLRKALQGTE